MYTEADYRTASSQTKLRLILMSALIAALLVCVLVFNSLRWQYPMLALAAVGFVLVYFLWSFKLTPWIRYNRFMRELKHGQRRTLECSFIYKTDETRLYDGVEVHDVLVTVGTEEKDERLFVLDADKQLPEIKEGDRLTVTSFGNFITDIELEA